jgi:hypothetical protein
MHRLETRVREGLTVLTLLVVLASAIRATSGESSDHTKTLRPPTAPGYLSAPSAR